MIMKKNMWVIDTWEEFVVPVSLGWLIVSASCLISNTISAQNSSVISHVGYHKLFSIYHHHWCWTYSAYLLLWLQCLSDLCSHTEVSSLQCFFALSPHMTLTCSWNITNTPEARNIDDHLRIMLRWSIVDIWLNCIYSYQLFSTHFTGNV